MKKMKKKTIENLFTNKLYIIIEIAILDFN